MEYLISHFNIQSMSFAQKMQLAESIAKIAHNNGLKVDTCAEDIDLRKFEISHARCIDDKLIERILGCPIVVAGIVMQTTVKKQSNPTHSNMKYCHHCCAAV